MAEIPPALRVLVSVIFLNCNDESQKKNGSEEMQRVLQQQQQPNRVCLRNSKQLSVPRRRQSIDRAAIRPRSRCHDAHLCATSISYSESTEEEKYRLTPPISTH